MITSFIPIQSGQSFLLQGQPYVSDLLGQTGYEVVGNSVVFTEDITLKGNNFVNMKLIVSDVSKLGDFDTLPIPADMEARIVEELFAMFAPSQTTNLKVDNYNTENNK